MSATPYAPPAGRAVFCNRTLNMRSIQAIGFDMDYTLVHYDVRAWEARAYAHVQQRLLAKGLPVGDLQFDPDLFARGLIVDLELGNIVKANRFGWVTQAAHGTALLSHDDQRKAYAQVWVDLSEKRWVFLNTLFSLSEACLYGQLVELRDRGLLGNLDYHGLYHLVGKTMDAAHLEGELKAEIIAAPERFVMLDPDLPRALLDLRHAGKKLFLATNSEWHYTEPMMRYAFDRYLGGAGWRSLFDLVITQSKKPSFFDGNRPFFDVEEQAVPQPVTGPLSQERVYRHGNAEAVQQHFGLPGEDILYVGDHVYADVHVSSQIRRWRTALVLRELEDEVLQERQFADRQGQLAALMAEKQTLEQEQATLRLAVQRSKHGEPLPSAVTLSVPAIHERLRALREQGDLLDQRLQPLVRAAGELGHRRFGPLLRAGSDKSRLARQIERHADVYTSRVSNLLWLTPFGYLRAARGSLPHDARQGSG